MSEEEFLDFLKKHWWHPHEIPFIIAEETPLAVQLRAKEIGNSITLEEAELVARKVRKQFAVNVSLIETGIVTPQELINHQF